MWNDLDYILQDPVRAEQSGVLRVAESWSVLRRRDSPYWIPKQTTDFRILKNHKKSLTKEKKYYIFVFLRDKGINQKESILFWPDPILSGSNSPDSILARIFFEHLRKASSTLSPVLALVSKNISPFSWANLGSITYKDDNFFFLHFIVFEHFKLLSILPLLLSCQLTLISSSFSTSPFSPHSLPANLPLLLPNIPKYLSSCPTSLHISPPPQSTDLFPPSYLLTRLSVSSSQPHDFLLLFLCFWVWPT